MSWTPPLDPGCSPVPTVLNQTKRAAGGGEGRGRGRLDVLRLGMERWLRVLPPLPGLLGPIQPLAAAAPPGTSSRYTRSRCSLTWGRTDVKETPGRPPCDTAKADSRGLVRGC